jgi:hypothetical protein
MTKYAHTTCNKTASAQKSIKIVRRFATTLLYMRRAVLRASPLLRAWYPDHILFLHPVYQTPEYKSFEEDFLKRYASQLPPHPCEGKWGIHWMDQKTDEADDDILTQLVSTTATSTAVSLLIVNVTLM